MEFIFICPETNEVFESVNFSITDNKGVQTDENGNRFLDARVKLNDPCPFCGKYHTYQANELACPFTG